MSSSLMELIFWENTVRPVSLECQFGVIQDGRHSRGVHCGAHCYVYFSARSFLSYADIYMFSAWIRDMFWARNPRVSPGLSFLQGDGFPKLKLRQRPCILAGPTDRFPWVPFPLRVQPFNPSIKSWFILLRIPRSCLLLSNECENLSPSIYEDHK